MTSEILIDSQAVYAALRDCLYQPEEIPDGVTIPDGAVMVKAIRVKYGFHPGRLEAHREQVRGWLKALPHQFRAEVGGGWSFLQACMQENGVQWTGEHVTMEMLFALGIGLGLAKIPLDRTLWSSLPGGMPYITLYLGEPT